MFILQAEKRLTVLSIPSSFENRHASTDVSSLEKSSFKSKMSYKDKLRAFDGEKSEYKLKKQHLMNSLNDVPAGKYERADGNSAGGAKVGLSLMQEKMRRFHAATKSAEKMDDGVMTDIGVVRTLKDQQVC